MSKLEIRNEVYPSGKPYKRVVFDGKALGIYDPRSDGFLPAGKRKPRSTEFEAILDVIADRQRDLLKQQDFLDKARSEVFERQREFKPVQ